MCWLALFGLILAPVNWAWLGLGAAGLATVIFLNRRFYTFLQVRQGLAFALTAVPLHLLYFLVASLGFAIAYAIFHSGRTGGWLSGRRSDSVCAPIKPRASK